MPKIEVFQSELFARLGKKLSNDELESLLECAKAELDGVDNENDLFKIELNDTNRPDLWSTAGLARQLAVYSGTRARLPGYNFFARPGDAPQAGYRIQVDPAVGDIRPFVVGFAVSGAPIDEASLNDLIQTQEKLCWNFGQKRRAIAMGVYRRDLITFPVQYTAVDPDTTRFQPLGLESELSMREMLSEHPKGQEFGHIVADYPKFPLLTDAGGEILSFPPVINSNRIGAVETGDRELFVELTGTDLHSLLLAASIVACDLADSGFTIHPSVVEYPYDTPFGREIQVPMYFQQPQTIELDAANRLLGVTLSGEDAVAALGRMGVPASVSGTVLEVRPPEYRNDFLHGVDIAEDIMIGKGMDFFTPEMPRDFSVGRLTPAEELARKVKMLMVGLGFQEMIFNYLGSDKDYFLRMYPEEALGGARAGAVHIANPMSENYAVVRPSILPSLLGAESISASAAYPHRIFEVGKVARRDAADVQGSVTENTLGWVHTEADTDFTQVSSQLAALLYYLGKEHHLEPSDDPRFIHGRAGTVMVDGRAVGVVGELHPRVLDAWGVHVPITAGEICLDRL
ncbi:phenylalanine--tRNA ligase subunit beta [Spirochaeta africana]|uniref:Phenylalanine--tRNA ligase beta subunit n=1 Tax=Spirochaeta africana (strain ATCC 700263 / DSM 8902 / Z-7692) TaxID=889378 RepID=H9UME1_SPIAZ|nr:phenylalanine--tRNA ligase subunit beta [Spirochaeta africana]AFG38684.1 phenylalanyl-tRNA synthetase, beta subunit [Spirochaeta africana DSM 8902]